MSVSQDLYAAILAMDAYNRGYNEGLQDVGDEIGLAVVTDGSDILETSAERQASFYAQSYTFDDEIIVAYRGTDAFLSDVPTYGLAIGDYDTDQSRFAAQFYQNIAIQADLTNSGGIRLVGHSLGGGLAGFVAGLYGSDAIIFDNMTFEQSVGAYAYDRNLGVTVDAAFTSGPIADDAVMHRDTTTGYFTTGEFLQATRIDQSTTVQGLNSYGGLRNPVSDLHSMSLLVLLLYASTNNLSKWQAAGVELTDALFDESLAATIGFGGEGEGGTSSAAEKLRTTLAYSAIDEGTRVFGDTGIRAYFDDADELGEAVSQTGGSLTSFQRDAIAKIVVQFAGHLAKNKMLQADWSEAVDGVLKLTPDKNLLAVDFADELWAFGQSEIVGRDVLTVNALSPLASPGDPIGARVDNAAAMQWLWGTNDIDVIDRIVLSTGTNGVSTVIEDRDTPNDKVTLVVTKDANDSITGSSHNDFIIGGGGADFIDGKDGDDYLHGGAGSDHLTGGGGKNYLEGGDGEDSAIYFADPNGAGIGADVTYLEDAGDGPAIVVDQTGGNFDRLAGIERIELSEKADYIRVDKDALKADVTIKFGESERDQNFIANVDVIDYSSVGESITYRNGQVALGLGQTIEAFLGGQQNLVVEDADKVVLTDSSDTFISGAVGTIVETGGGNDRIWFTDGIGVSDLSMDDRVSLFGVVNLYGGVKAKYSETPYATGFGGLVQYGKNVAGELVIRLPLGETPMEMFILNWQQDASFHPFGGEIGPGNITLTEYDIQAVRLIEDWPSGYGYFQTWELFGLLTKSITGVSAWKGIDPLVLDLDGDGFELTTESTAAPVFDIDSDLYGERTGWVRPDDGFLVRDIDGDGEITDSREMFGGRTSGFSALALLDGNADGKVDAGDNGLADLNGDGVIDANDTFNDLLVWQDRNQNAEVDAGELKSLDELGITSISVTPTAASAVVNGNQITATATFTRADGSTGLAGDVVFRTNNVDSVYEGAPITISTAAAEQPNLKGYGSLVSLHEALSIDGSLIPAVEASLGNFSTPDLEALKIAVRPILQAWAKGSPIRLADGEVVTGDAGLLATPDLQAIVDGDVIKDYAYAHSGNTWSFASGTTVTVRNVTGDIDLALFAAQHETDTVDRVDDTVLIGGVSHLRQTYTFGSGAILEFTGRFGVSTPLVSLLAGGSDDVAWKTVSGSDLAFFERYLGETFPFHAAPDNSAAAFAGLKMVLENIEQTLELLAVRIAVQAGPLASIFDSIHFDAADDAFKPDDGTDQLALVYEALIDRATGASDPIASLSAWKPFLDVVIGDYHRGEAYLQNTYGFLAQNIVAAFEQANPSLAFLDVVSALGVPRDIVVAGTGEMLGTAEADIFYISGANQTATGGGGLDTYVIGSHLGHTVIDDREVFFVDEKGDDLVRFATLKASDVEATREGIDLLLTVIATGETLRIKDQFEGTQPGLGGLGDLSDGTGVSEIVFADGTVWGAAEMARAVSKVDAGSTTVTGTRAVDFIEGGTGNDRLEGGGDSDVYIIGRGDGVDTIYDLESIATRNHFDIVTFTDGLRFADLTLARDGDSNDLTISVKGTADSVTIINQFQFFDTVLGQFWLTRIDAFTFDDGSSFAWTDVFQLLIDQNTTAGDDSIYGFAHLDDVLDGGSGDDLMAGMGGSDTYIFGQGSGNDTIVDFWDTILTGNDDKIIFGEGLNAEDVILSRQGDYLNDIKITFAGNSSESLVIEDQFFYTTFVNLRLWEISEFRFADGTVWTDVDIRARYLEQIATSGNDVIEGFWSQDTLIGGAGDDILRGGDFADTYLFADGFGNDRIEEEVLFVTYPDDDQVVFEGSLASTAAHFARLDDDLIISFDGATDTLRSVGQFAEHAYSDIELFTFSDGVSITDVQLFELLLSQWTTSGDDSIVAFRTNDTISTGEGNDTIKAGRGQDTLSGGLGNDTLIGGEGSDTYLYDRGDGNDVIDESSDVWSQSDVLRLSGITADHVTLERSGRDVTLVIAESAVGAGDNGRISLTYQLDGFISRGVDRVEFVDGSAWSAHDLRLKVLTVASTDGDDVIVGYNTDDILSGGLGNDTLTGGEGRDTYLYRRGDGNDVIDESSDVWSESDKLMLSDVTAGQVTLERSGGDVSLVIAESAVGAGDGGRILLKMQLDEFISRGVDSIFFSDGTSWTPNDLRAMLLAAASTGHNDIIDGYNTDDSLNGWGGNDTISGFSGNDTLAGGTGNDVLAGGGGEDTYLYARGDGDDVVDESNAFTGAADKLNLSSVTTGQVTLERNGNDVTLIIAETAPGAGDGGRITLKSQLDPNYEHGVESIVFADSGITWLKTDVAAAAAQLLITHSGTSAAEMFQGTSGNDIFHGRGGNDNSKAAPGVIPTFMPPAMAVISLPKQARRAMLTCCALQI